MRAGTCRFFLPSSQALLPHKDLCRLKYAVIRTIIEDDHPLTFFRIPEGIQGFSGTSAKDLTCAAARGRNFDAGWTERRGSENVFVYVELVAGVVRH